MIFHLLGGASVVIGIIAYIPYVRGILAGKFKPHAFTWFVWTITNSIVLAAQWVSNAGAGMWVTGFSSIMCVILTVLGAYRGEKSITTGDKVALVAALLSVPLWWVTKDPLWSVIWVTLIDIFGFYPTFRKAYAKPWEESPLSFGTFGLATALSLPAMTSATLTTMLAPATISASNILLVLMILWRRQKSSAESQSSAL